MKSIELFAGAGGLGMGLSQSSGTIGAAIPSGRTNAPVSIMSHRGLSQNKAIFVTLIFNR
jgi:hypothetical protein